MAISDDDVPIQMNDRHDKNGMRTMGPSLAQRVEWWGDCSSDKEIEAIPAGVSCRVQDAEQRSLILVDGANAPQTYIFRRTTVYNAPQTYYNI